MGISLEITMRAQVIISPHSAITADAENEKLTELFCDTLRGYLKSVR
jgi:hypothetical protein